MENYNTDNILEKPELIIKKLEKWFQKVINSEPTMGHIYLEKICNKIDSSIITGNFDILHEKSGIIPIKVHKFEKFNDQIIKNGKFIKLLVVIGISIDFRKIIEDFRKNGTKIVIFAYNEMSIPHFVKDDDYVIIGDLHKNLKKLYKMIVENK